MTNSFQSPLPFLSKKRKTHIEVVALSEKSLKAYIKAAKAPLKKQIENAGFEAKAKTSLVLTAENGDVQAVLFGLSAPVSLYDSAYAYNAAKAALSTKTLKETSFGIAGDDLGAEDLDKLHTGWGWPVINSMSTAKKTARSAPPCSGTPKRARNASRACWRPFYP